MKLTYCLLAISILLALFNRNRVIIYACIALISMMALYENLMTITGATYIVVLALLIIYYFNQLAAHRKLKSIAFIAIAVLLGGIVLHKIPGFANQRILNNYLVSAASHPYSLWLNFDKVFAALIVFTLSPLLSKESTVDASALKQTILIWVACVVVIFGPAVFSGYVKFDPKIPAILPIWAFANFLFVCFSEEVIFRGFLQTALKRYLPRGWQYTLVAIIIAAIFFGLSHYKGGMMYVGLAALAGIFYGYAYERTNRILCAMLVHFALNLTHIMLFSYPY